MIFHHTSITPAAFAYAADDTEDRNTIADIIGGEDYRDVTVFYRHDWAAWTTERIKEATIIGVVLGLDDTAPQAMSRDDARAMFGDDRITAWEAVRSEAATRDLAWEMKED